MIKVLKDTEERAKEEIKLLLKKPVWNPEEVKCVGEYVDMLKDIAEVCGMNEFFDGDANGYSGAPYGIMMPQIDYNGTSHRRGRSPSTGRFVSRSDGPMDYDWERSGHLEKDEVMKKLERFYDDAETNSQREFVKKLMKEFEHK